MGRGARWTEVEYEDWKRKKAKGDTPVSSANVEPDTGDGYMAKKTVAGRDSPCAIHVTSYRKRMHDTDGISAKAVLDSLVRRGILEDDNASVVKEVTFTSKECESGCERTIIDIYEWRE